MPNAQTGSPAIHSAGANIDKGLIKALVEAWGPPGYEYQVRDLIRAHVKDLADDIQVDRSGALICRMGSGGPKIMIAAHMDEIGLFVHHIDRNGYARFSLNGYLLVLGLHGARVRFENGALGVIMAEDPFIPKKLPTIQDFYIDFSSGAESFADVRVGSVGALIRDYTEQGDRIIAESLDDRIGCAVAIETMRRLKGQQLPAELYFVFTTQEEVGIRGARAAAHGIDPAYAIALDVTLAGDQPGNEKLAVKLGAGVAINVRDAAHIVPPWIKDRMIERAEAAGIPYQLAILDLGTTDASAIQMTRSGIPSGVIAIPCRGVHSQSEMVDIHDLEASVALLTELLRQPFQP